VLDGPGRIQKTAFVGINTLRFGVFTAVVSCDRETALSTMFCKVWAQSRLPHFRNVRLRQEDLRKVEKEDCKVRLMTPRTWEDILWCYLQLQSSIPIKFNKFVTKYTFFFRFLHGIELPNLEDVSLYILHIF
jgi:hypothetical protein